MFQRQIYNTGKLRVTWNIWKKIDLKNFSTNKLKSSDLLNDVDYRLLKTGEQEDRYRFKTSHHEYKLIQVRIKIDDLIWRALANNETYFYIVAYVSIPWILYFLNTDKNIHVLNWFFGNKSKATINCKNYTFFLKFRCHFTDKIQK